MSTVLSMDESVETPLSWFAANGKEDSLGALAIKKIPAHFMELTEITSQFSSVGLLTPDVHGHTNIKTKITLSGIADGSRLHYSDRFHPHGQP